MTSPVPDEREKIVAELRRIPGVSEKAAEALCMLGIRSAADLEGRDPVTMYEDLRNRRGSYAEPCLLSQLKVAVTMAEKERSKKI